MTHPKRWILACACLLAALRTCPSLADTLNRSWELGTSISGAYDSRSLFSNPAALGYQTELNGAQFLSSFTLGSTDTSRFGGSAALSYGYLGVGVEKLQSPGDSIMRYSLGLGVPLGNALYVGGRYVLDRSDDSSFHYDSFDVGLQYRATSFLSFGFEANGINTPDANGTTIPAQFIGGLTLRPARYFELTADAGTFSNGFGSHWGYQGILGVMPWEGAKLWGGYNDELKWQFGLQINIEHVALYGGLTGNSYRQQTIGVEMSSQRLAGAAFGPNALEIDIDGSLSEEAVDGGFFSADRPSLLSVLTKLERAGDDPRIRFVLVKIDHFPLGLAAAEELHQALVSLEKKDKQVEVFLSGGTTKEYLIAAGAKTIHIEKSAELRLVGLRSESYFLKGTMDKIGVQGEFLARGEYKSAPEMFTRKESSPINREASLEEMREAETEILRLLKPARGIDKAAWDKITDHALYSADEAVAAHLVEASERFSQEKERLRQAFHFTGSLDEASDRLALPPRVAVITANGDILEHKMTVLSVGGLNQVTPKKLEEHLKEALGDDRTKAIVLRVSSPGGEVQASDEMAALIESAKEKKPVIVSMGDVAASGGYMISAPADRIFADPLTFTGSVGVFLGKFNFGELYKKIDLNKQILGLGPHPGLYSEDRAWTPEERAIMTRRLDDYYHEFVSYVAHQRKLSFADAESAAKGRVWMGEAARARKLTDESGGLMDAVHYAAKSVNLREDDYEIWEVATNPGLFAFAGEDGIFSRATRADVSILSGEALRQIIWMSRLSENPFLYLSRVGKIE